MDFLLNTKTDWNLPPKARHQVARTLAKKHKVVYISTCRVGKPRIESRMEGKNLTILQPYWHIGGGKRVRTPILNEVYQNWLFSKLKKKYIKYIVINFDYSANRMHKFFNNVIYYSTDDPLKRINFFDKFIIPYHAYNERIVLKNSIFMISVSDYLHKVKKIKKKYLLYLGADTDKLQVGEEKDLYKINRDHIIINYFGVINSRLEFGWIKKLAEEEKDWQIELVGPLSNKNKQELESYPNVKLYGLKLNQELVEILQKATVAIIPFKDNSRMRTVSANNKYWQYLLLGKPVVYRDLPYLLDVPQYLMYKASTYLEFKEKIHQAIAENNEEYIKQRIEFAKNHTWEDRIQQMLGFIKENIPQTDLN